MFILLRGSTPTVWEGVESAIMPSLTVGLLPQIAQPWQYPDREGGHGIRDHALPHGRATATDRSTPAPTRLSLLQKRPDAFLRVIRHHVQAHDLLGVIVSLGLTEIDLRVEGLFAYADD